MKRTNSSGFAIIEILIAITILSICLLTIISGVSTGIVTISGNKNYTIAMLIAKSKINEFQAEGMTGVDIVDEPVKEYDGFRFSRAIKKFEHELLIEPANQVDVTVTWKDRDNERKYVLSYIYSKK